VVMVVRLWGVGVLLADLGWVWFVYFMSLRFGARCLWVQVGGQWLGWV